MRGDKTFKERPQPKTVGCGNKKIKLIEDFVVNIPEYGLDFTIEAGFEWDGMSIPRIAWTLMGSPFLPRFKEASLIHDYLYFHRAEGS